MHNIPHYSLIIIICLSFCCSCDRLSFDDVSDTKSNCNHKEFAISFKNINYESLNETDTLFSDVIPIGENGEIETVPSAKVSEVYSAIGVVINTGTVKALWPPGIGDALVPEVFTGTRADQITICDIYEISAFFTVKNDDEAVRGVVGLNSGYSNATCNNQERWQGFFQKSNNQYRGHGLMCGIPSPTCMVEIMDCMIAPYRSKQMTYGFISE